MNLVVIESPYAGDVEANVAYARAALLDSLTRGEAPFASHLMYPGALDDDIPAERNLGIRAGWAWGMKAGLVAFYVDRGWSPGMKAALDMWSRGAVPIEHRRIEERK